MSAVVLIAIVSLLTSYLLWSRRHLYYLSWKFGGRMGYPLIGSFFDHLNVVDFGEYFKNVIWRKYNSPCVIWLGGKMHILVNDPEYAQLALTSSNILDKHSLYELYHPIGGKNGLNFSKGKAWTLQRRILNTSLNLVRVNKMVPGFNVAFEKYIKNYFKPALNKGAVDLYKGLQQTVFSMAFENITGKSLSWVESKAKASMHDFVTVAQSNIEDRTLKVYLHSDFTYSLTNNYKETMSIVGKIHDVLKSYVFDNQTKEGLEFTEPGDAVFDVIQSNSDKPGFSGSEARFQLYQILLGSYETTTFTVYMIMFCMALYPEHQEKVYEELKTLFPDRNVKLDADNLGGLVFTEMFINEVLRMFPPIPLIGRTCTKDTVLRNGTFIPKGVEFLFDLAGLHRNKKYWGPDADKFNPYNFLPENKESRPTNAFIPFALGTRNCIGIRYAKSSLKIAVVKIFRNFRLETPNKFEDIKYKRGLTMKVVTPVTFRVFERSE